MRRSRALAAGAAVAAVAVGLAAPTATAWDNPSNITATPSVVAPGGRMTVTVDGSSCQRPGSTVESPVFPRTRLTSLGGNTARATVTVDHNAHAGSYGITARCGDGKTLTRSDAFSVVGGVRGGIGGSSTSGATATDIAIGGGLVTLAVIGGGVFWMRRRSESRA
ncbi:hypothetical protein [Streptomyces cavernae]|uniref:hypothetical protein n=1 Tax=Streptomyces cavernae TaxID=2259034 RepID=UPI000FEB6EF8|nr:hypothetical protein [Streptomyces cavernae]